MTLIGPSYQKNIRTPDKGATLEGPPLFDERTFDDVLYRACNNRILDTMALLTSYLTSTKNLASILEAIRGAQAPPRFTLAFLESLDFPSSSDRLIVPVLKGLGFLTESGEPTQRYFDYLDETRSAAMLAEAIKEAYGDLFRVNLRANEMSRADVKNKLRTLTQGQINDLGLDRMALTFKGLSELADFSATAESPPATGADAQHADAPASQPPARPPGQPTSQGTHLNLGGLVYNIQLVLPESRDPSVYDALFRSLREHLTG